MDNYSLKDIFNIYESKVPKRENGNSKHIHKDFWEPKCHCECAALRRDSQNHSESHRLCQRTLWFCAHSWSHRRTEKRNPQWFLWKFIINTWIHGKLQTYKNRFGGKDNYPFGKNSIQKINTFLYFWTEKRRKTNWRKWTLMFIINFESLFGEKWNQKWLNKKVLWNHCKWTDDTEKRKRK